MVFTEPGDAATLGKLVRTAFRDRFGLEAAAVARAPGRVNLIGEHTDYNAGLCLPLALPHATYAAAAVRTDGVVRISSGLATTAWSGSVDAIGPGQVDGWAAYAAGVLWALREDGAALPGVDLHLESTVPPGAGLSSSAALGCAVAVALTGLGDDRLDDATRHRLVRAAMRAESEVAGAPTGGMDQTVSLLSAPGAALLIDFESGATRRVPLPLAEAGLALLVVDTGVSHALVDGGYAARRADCEEAARAAGVATLRQATTGGIERIDDQRLRQRARHVVSENERVRQVCSAVAAGDWDRLGALLDASHLSLRDDFEVSCPELDAAVEAAREGGALGARMTGGGFGGSAIALVPLARLDRTVACVEAAFAARGFAPPGFLRAVPSGAGDLC